MNDLINPGFVRRTIDAFLFWIWKRFQNGSEELQTAYQTVLDTEDSLDAIQQAIQDADYSSALTLINSSRESLQEHIETLRDLL